MIEDLY